MRWKGQPPAAMRSVSRSSSAAAASPCTCTAGTRELTCRCSPSATAASGTLCSTMTLRTRPTRSSGRLRPRPSECNGGPHYTSGVRHPNFGTTSDSPWLLLNTSDTKHMAAVLSTVCACTWIAMGKKSLRQTDSAHLLRILTQCRHAEEAAGTASVA